MRPHSLAAVNQQIVACARCPRLVEYRERVAREKRRAFLDQTYWGRPVPGFGDPHARVMIVGLAPAAHGGNRTGRVFTGDSSGDFLYAALHRAGFANQPTAVHRDDGLTLADAYIVAVIRCAPPDNKPRPDEIAHCRNYLDRELELLSNVRVIVALGKLAFDNTLAALSRRGIAIPTPRPAFGHNRAYRLGEITLIASYHPSQRNTQTGLLTRAMFDRVFRRAICQIAPQ
ncbi:MAG: uracil-DNA glycosylase [Chloroflexi bacterium]|nr:uracil-DNA glycosylase [Chloroflexota bacterium]